MEEGFIRARSDVIVWDGAIGSLESKVRSDEQLRIALVTAVA